MKTKASIREGFFKKVSLAISGCVFLKSLRDRWYLTKLCSVVGLSRLLREVCGRSKERKHGNKVSVAKARQILELLRPVESADDATDQFMAAGRLRKALDDARKSLDVRDLNVASKLPVAKIRNTLGLLRLAEKTGKGEGKSMDAEQLRHLLDEIQEALRDSDLNAAAKVPARYFDGMIADEMKRVADGLEKGLRMKPLAKQQQKEALKKLLRDLTPYSGERKCRPYELFLFAAQKRLRQEKLVRRRNSLASNVWPNPPKANTSLSILVAHQGGDLAMGIDESQ